MPITGPDFHPLDIRDSLQPCRGKKLIAGFSGGGDSLALLLATSEWARAEGRELLPVIIDHGLRPESRQETHWACERASRLGWKPIRVEWTGAKPKTGLQVAARAFRLKTFAKLAHEHGARTVFLGHTLDDQVETVWRRLVSGGRWPTLCAMLPKSGLPLWPHGRGLELIRPLLATRRVALRRWLDAQGENWIDDPANENPAFSRVVDRQLLAKLESAGFDLTGLASLARQLHEHRNGLAVEAARWIEAHAIFYPWGGVQLDRDATPALETMDVLRAAITGRPESDQPAAESLLAGLAARQAATAGGTALTFTGNKAWLVRDPGAVLGRVDGTSSAPRMVPSGPDQIWDGRFCFQNFHGEIWPLGMRWPENFPPETLRAVPELARKSLPGLWKRKKFEGVAGLTVGSANASWLAEELIQRHLFGVEAPDGVQFKLRGELAQGSH